MDPGTHAGCVNRMDLDTYGFPRGYEGDLEPYLRDREGSAGGAPYYDSPEDRRRRQRDRNFFISRDRDQYNQRQINSTAGEFARNVQVTQLHEADAAEYNYWKERNPGAIIPGVRFLETQHHAIDDDGQYIYDHDSFQKKENKSRNDKGFHRRDDDPRFD
jgi:hypothetical protein